MTKSEWLAKLNSNRETLKQFVIEWHPASAVTGVGKELPITAPNPESARRLCVDQIKQEETHLPEIAERWDTALAAGDVGELCGLLDGAWFGVPESTSCWSVLGFSAAVDLIDDMPEEEEG